MIKASMLGVASCLVLSCAGACGAGEPRSDPAYSDDGKLQLPQDYREWVFLSSGFDMSYQPAMQMAHHVFDNVFVNPDAYRQFRHSGTWPDRTVLVLEIRGARNRGSINQAGHYQEVAPVELEVHVKDERHFPGHWAFFAFGAGSVGTLLPASAECYACHAAHGAVDTTFVQFYPTLLPWARAKGTVSKAFKEEEAGAQHQPREP